jgi:cysteinyl-tRNA synthetase
MEVNMRLTDKEVEAMLEYWLNTVNMGKFYVADRIRKELRDMGIQFKLLPEGITWQRIEEQVDEDYATQCIYDYYAR